MLSQVVQPPYPLPLYHIIKNSIFFLRIPHKNEKKNVYVIYKLKLLITRVYHLENR